MNQHGNLLQLKNKISTYLLLIGVLLLFSCTRNANEANIILLQTQIDTLQNQLQEVNTNYKPELGEIMSHVQLHHAKLWFAGTNKNWQLAEYEIHEITEAFEKVEKLHPVHDNQPIAQLLPLMIFPEIDSILNSIKQKNITDFMNTFNILTNSCNNCHRATQHEFNVIKTPDSPPVSNQVFTPTQP